MKQGILAIYDKDTAYACRLMEYLNQNKEFFLEARVFTDLLHLQDYLEEMTVEVLLVGERISLDTIDKEQIRHIMLLSEHGMVCEESEYPHLYKYQSMEGLVKEIVLCYSGTGIRAGTKLLEMENEKTLIGVFSPFGGSGKTLFSIALGQALLEGTQICSEGSEMAGAGKENSRYMTKMRRVLYIGMEMMSSFEAEENIRGNLSDILFWIRERKEGCLSGLTLMTEKRGNLDCIFAPDYYEDLLNLTEEDMDFLIKELGKNTPYEVIIFDIGCWNQATFYLLEQMQEIYMPDFLNRTFLKKENSLVTGLKLTGKNGLYEKIKKVEVPFDDMIYQGKFDLNKMDKTKMGQYVCRLIKKNLISSENRF